MVRVRVSYISQYLEMISDFDVQVLELQECGVQLEQCQLVRYNQHTRTLGKPFDEPKVGTDCNVCQKDHQMWLAAISTNVLYQTMFFRE